jgi:RimJ/RimL family protein N-acetyltransferase
VRLLDYTGADLALSVALETDPEVMSELGGPRELGGIEKAHRSRVATAGKAGLWLKVLPGADDTAAGAIGVWRSQWEDAEVWEAGWMLLPAFQGRGLAKRALAMLIERLRADPAYDLVHAFPGVTNVPSNALCRGAGFDLRGESEVEFAGRPLRVNHWVLDLAAEAVQA